MGEGGSPSLGGLHSSAAAMLASDTYRTITAPAEGTYSQLRSKFLAFALPVRTVDDVRRHVAAYAKRFYDARHVCYAYILGPERTEYRANDNGEPSSTAGKPILGQINANELTDILVIVVRYFGGVKLGTSGLIVAYRTAAAEAIARATIVERTIDDDVVVAFPYPLMNAVMRIVKEEQPRIVEQGYNDGLSTMTLRIRRSLMPCLRERLEGLLGLQIISPGN